MTETALFAGKVENRACGLAERVVCNVRTLIYYFQTTLFSLQNANEQMHGEDMMRKLIR